jgi:hypothetical protein
MKGDFSNWQFNPNENFNGVLQQQGRVQLDRDWNEQTRINQHWQDIAGSDIIGPGVAAVPVTDPDGFKVVQANVTGAAPNQRVELLVQPGRIWADGQLCYLPPGSPGSSAPVLRVADYLLAPIDPTPGSIATIGPGIRDAVILEVSREELSAFQNPTRLLEPALGGPDTTERVQLRTAFKLFRLAPGENCHSIIEDLRDDPSEKGRLTVQLQPTVVTPGDCPVVAGGGYTGFEHYLYRVEIAAQDAAQPPSFKWSQFNGGLVGRGQLITGPNRITIAANQAAILNSGLTSFYCEILSFDPVRGTWNPTFGADVTLNNGELVVGAIRLGAFSASTSTVFFRLWNGLEPIADFDDATPVELLDGIQLAFDPATATNYASGDFWTFTVRAGEIVNPDTLVDDLPPFGPVYHRVPIAEIDWSVIGTPVVPPEIEDCRRRFRPLTRLDTCCTVRVGDGFHSLGDYTSIQQAIASLPAEGGMVCILPGIYREAVSLINRVNITLSGCGPRTRLVAPATASGIDAVITIHGGANLAIESLAVEASPRGRGIFALGLDPFSKIDQIATSPIDGLTLRELTVTSSIYAAIRVANIRNFALRDSAVHMTDTTCQEYAVVVLADDALIEHNIIEVRATPVVIGIAASAVPVSDDFTPGSFSRGGLHLESLCERVQVIDNLIQGGCGNGINLGSIHWFTDGGDRVPPEDEPEEPEDDPCDPTQPVDTSIDDDTVTIGDGVIIRRSAGGPLYDIRIERNRIQSMGTNGIAVIGFFDLSRADEFISIINLSILGNDIRRCLRRSIAAPVATMVNFMGFGGIALADVENFVAHDNTIVDNGPDWHSPVCGVFVLHGEGIDLSRNRIVNNGAATTEPVSGARRGQRGGIVVRYALPPSIAIDLTATRAGRMQNGVPAARLHDNIVSTPLGRALTVYAVGPVSVESNQLTSQGIPPSSVDWTGLMAGTVLIMNLGFSNELYLQTILFSALNKSPNYLTAATVDAAARAGLDDATMGRLLANGQVLFNDNQVNLDLLALGNSVSISSVLILTLDDLSFADNQCEANLALRQDFLIVNTLALAMSVRTESNRWKEGLYNALLSALTIGLMMNTTVVNQGTHCIIARGWPPLLVDEGNTVLIEPILEILLGDNYPDRGFCRQAFSKFMPNLAKSTPTIGGQVTGVANSQPQNVLTLLR